MKKSKKTSVITVSLDSDVKADLDQMSLELDLTISKLARNLIYTTLDDYELLNVFGINKHIYNFRASCNSLQGIDSFEKSDAKSVDSNAQISIIIDSEVKGILERYANNLEVTLKQFARNLIYIGLNDLKLLKKTGVLRLSVAFDQFIKGYLGFKKSSEK